MQFCQNVERKPVIMRKLGLLVLFSVALEAGGASLIYSINYDRLLKPNGNKNLAIRTGFMYINFSNEQERKMIGIPVGVSYLEGRKKNFLEIGITASAIIDRYSLYCFDRCPGYNPHHEDFILLCGLKIGLRHQPSKGRFFWNVGFQNTFVIVNDSVSYFRSIAEPEIFKFENALFRSYFPYLSVGAGISF